MAINPNLTRALTGTGRFGDSIIKTGTGRSAPTTGPAAPAQPSRTAAPVTAPAAPAAPPKSPATSGLLSSAVAFQPNVFAQPFFPVFQPAFTIPKTATQLAQGAINLLKSATPAVVQEAITTIKNRNVTADNLINYLERKVIIGEALNELAKDWSAETKQDFAEAFQMPTDKLDVMDAIVSVAILNDPDLKEELQIENTPETTEGDLLENRRIVWQYPPPGTVLQPPYVVLLAVEHTDTQRAEEIVNSIIEELVAHQGYKIPKAVAQKLGGGPISTRVPPLTGRSL